MLSISAGPLVTTPHRLFFLLALAVALLVGWIHGRRRHIAVEPALTQMVLYGLLSARVVFVLVYWGDYWREPWRVVDIRDGGFFLAAGVFTAVTVALYHAWRSPRGRITLALSIGSGFLVWGIGITLFNSVMMMQPRVDELALTGLDGRPVSISELRGKPVVVNIWATWCPPCRREMPVLAEAQQREQGIAFVFVNQGEASAAVSDYLVKEQLALANVYLDPAGEWSRQLGANALPTTLFFDHQGELVSSHTGELSPASLKQALKKIPRSPPQ